MLRLTLKPLADSMTPPLRPTRKLLLGIAALVVLAVWFCWPEENPFAGVVSVPLTIANETAIQIDDRTVRTKNELPVEQPLTNDIAVARRRHRDDDQSSTDFHAGDEFETETTERLPPIDYGFVPTEQSAQWITNEFYSADRDNGEIQAAISPAASLRQGSVAGSGIAEPGNHNDFVPATNNKSTSEVVGEATNPGDVGLVTSSTTIAPTNDFPYFGREAEQEPFTPRLPVPPTGADLIATSEAPAEASLFGPTSQVHPATMTTPLTTEGDGGPSKSTQGTTDYVLASHPKVGDHYKDEQPLIDCGACEIPAITEDFAPDAIHSCLPYDPHLNQGIYNSKQLNANQRPLLELGRPWYQLGQLSPGSSLLGFHNNVNPQFLIFGDYRQAVASNTIDGDNSTQLAFELNTFWNLHLTSTERIVWGISPLDDGVRNTRWEFDRDRFEFETDFDFDFGYFEGDLGALAGGFTGRTLPFDAPFAVGLTPMLIQNGIWLNDAVEGAFFTIPARNSPLLGISNMDVSFGFVWDDIDSDAFIGDNSAAKAYAIYSFIEALNGYIELDYAFLEDRSALDRSYHNISVAYSRRFGRFLSHSTRVVANAGQQVSAGDQTADGVLLLSENSLITANPYSVIPYFNFFAGFDTPQSVAGDDELLNTGILFESDGMTGYPTLDIRAQETAGGAVGLNLLAPDFSQQLILEAAAVFRQDDSDLAGDQYGVGMRYQLPLSNSWIFRTDSMYGFFRGDSDDFGMRMELRKKF